MADLQLVSRPSEDDWHGVTDPKKRKKIQDKLAQRARRKRLREAKQDTQPTIRTAHAKTNHARRGSHYRGLTDGAGDDLESPDSLDLMPCLDKLSPASSLCRRCSSQTTPVGQSPDIGYEPCPSMTVIGAMYVNGIILGLKSCTVVPQVSSPAGSDVPYSLQPTYLQLTVIHQTGIDRFPFPKMRDNMINLYSTIDEEEFGHDLCLMPSFNITPGMAPWDPKAWTIEKYFAKKWGYLFC